MKGVVLPGNSTVAFREQPVPTPGHGQVLVQMKGAPSAAATSAPFTASIWASVMKPIAM